MWSLASNRGQPGSPVVANATNAARIAVDSGLKSGGTSTPEAIAAAIRMGAPGRSLSAARRDARGLQSLVEGLLLQVARRDISPAEAAAVITRFVAMAFSH